MYYLFTKFGFDTAENEPLNVSKKLTKRVRIVRKNIGFYFSDPEVNVTRAVVMTRVRGGGCVRL